MAIRFDDWPSKQTLPVLVGIASAVILVASFAAVVWIGWGPARLIIGPDANWLPNIAGVGSAAALALCFSLRALLGPKSPRSNALDDHAQSAARRDDLTGLLNRAAFHREVASRSERIGTAPFTLLLVDLDRFKAVNDTHGHQAGDIVLVTAARRLAEFFGPGAVVGRLGGDEFAVCAPATGDRATIVTVASRLIVELSRPVALDVGSAAIGASIGFAIAPEDGTTCDEILRRADQALYTAKRQGRGRAVPFDVGMEKDIAQRAFNERELRGGILSGEIDVEYQPIVQAESGGIVGVEALARWRHAYRGTISPAAFIPLAEETGLINQIGRIVLEKACAAAVGWGTSFVSVNVSPVQMRDPEFPALVAEVLRRTGFPARRLILEITEGMLIEDPEKARVIIDSLKRVGVRMALDDFGTGYSSLSYLHDFAFDKLKVDRSFVGKMEARGDVAAIVRCVASLGRALGMTVIAEGVETPEQRDLLCDAGCDQLQGYLFGKPMSRQAVETLLRAGSGRGTALAA